MYYHPKPRSEDEIEDDFIEESLIEEMFLQEMNNNDEH